MINANTPFLNRDGTIAREWLLFFLTLNNAVGNPNGINASTVSDIQITAEIDEAIDDSSRVPQLVQQSSDNQVSQEIIDSINFTDQIPQILQQSSDSQTYQDMIDAVDLSEQMPTLAKKIKAVSVLSWMDI